MLAESKGEHRKQSKDVKKSVGNASKTGQVQQTQVMTAHLQALQPVSGQAL